MTDPKESVMNNRIESVRAAMMEYFGADRRRINHALRVTEFAEKILREEPGNRELVIVAALLHDIGIHEAERKHGSSAGNLQELEGPPIAREMLTSLGYENAFVDEVCEIIASHHSPGEVESDNFRVIWDADWLVNVGDELDLNDIVKLKESIGKIFMTSMGKSLAEEIYLKES
jgi:putative nucleotidyltransferase with HDIG domain